VLSGGLGSSEYIRKKPIEKLDTYGKTGNPRAIDIQILR